MDARTRLPERIETPHGWTTDQDREAARRTADIVLATGHALDERGSPCVGHGVDSAVEALRSLAADENLTDARRVAYVELVAALARGEGR